MVYDPKITEEITKNGCTHTSIIISVFYKVDEMVIEKYKEIYGEYPPTFLTLTERSEYYKQHLIDIERVLKINKIIKRYGRNY